MKLTEHQEEVANFKDGNLQVIASAGSGKTTSISERVSRLIDSGVDPSKIVAFTFTDKAAEAMRFKISKALIKSKGNTQGIEQMYVGTIHSFCFEVLKNHIPRYLNYDVLDENQRALFVKKKFYNLKLNNPALKTRWYGSNANPIWTTISNVLKNVDILKEEMINCEDLSNKDFLEFFKNYNLTLEKEKYLDFTSIMDLTRNFLMNDKIVLKEVRDRVDYLIIDEYQDINPLQEQIIELISNKKNVCVVGDDDQSIYQWRGTKVENMLQFHKRYNNVKRIELLRNFRSTSQVIETANKIISKIPKENRLQKKMIQGNLSLVSEKGDIYYDFVEEEKEEIEFIINKMKELRSTEVLEDGIKRAMDWRDFAVILRSVKNFSGPLIKRLKEEEIPFIVRGSVGLFDREEIRMIVNLFEDLFNVDFKRLNLSGEKEKEIYDSIFEGDHPSYEHFKEQFRSLKNEVSKKKTLNVQNIFHRVLNIAGFEGKTAKEEIVFNLGKLSQVIEDYESQNFPIKNAPRSLMPFFEFLFEYASEKYEEGTSEERFGTINAVQIMTMHRCKGLEFQAVFLPYNTKHIFPKKRNDSTNWFIDESLFKRKQYATSEDNQRRLLYVALTRSMKFLFITGSLNIEKYKRKQKPSEFFSEISMENAIGAKDKDPSKRIKSDNFIISPLEDFFPTTYSELKDYFECPYCFKLNKVFGFRPSISPMIGYGNGVHNILNIIHKQSKKNIKPNIDNLLDENFKLRFAPPDKEETSKKRARQVVEGYLKSYSEDIELSLETEKPFEVQIGNAIITGEVDLIKRETPSGDEITVIDFKTEKDPPKYRKKEHKEQVILYGLACEKLLDKKPSKLYVHYLDSGGGRREEVETHDRDAKKLLSRIASAVDHIKDGDYSRRKSVMDFLFKIQKESDFGNLCDSCKSKKP